MFVSVSSRCFSDLPFADACQQLSDLGYDKVEIWMSDKSEHLKTSHVAENIDRFMAHYREVTRMTPVALCLENDLDATGFDAICKLAKQLKITQITLPAAPLGTPFNEEIDRLRSRLAATNQSGIRLSLKTKTGDLTEDPRTSVELCQSVQGLGLTLDLSYYMVGPYANQPTDPIFPYVYHMHLRDTNKKNLQVPVGLGDMDYARSITLLRRQNYTRALSVDLLPELMGESDRPLELRKIRMLMETLL